MEQDFKNNRYASNRSVLKDLYERYNVASHPYIAATVLMILSLIIGCIWQSCADYHDDAPYGIIGLAVGMVSFCILGTNVLVQDQRKLWDVCLVLVVSVLSS